MRSSTKAIQKVQFANLFCCGRLVVSSVQCDVKKCLVQLYVGPCHVVSEEIAVAMAVPIENPADCEVRSDVFYRRIRSQVILTKRQALAWNYFVCKTMHFRILPERHKSCCVSNCIWDILEHPPYSPDLAP